MVKNLIFRFSILFMVGIGTNISAQETPCNYFGLAEPKDTPQNFNPTELDRNGRFKFNVEFKKCDEIYFTTIDTKENIYVSKRRNNRWSQPQIASFSDPNYNDADPFLTKNGSKLYFISTRPTHASDKNQDYNIWFAENKNGGWGAPRPLSKPINSDEFDEYFFSVSDKGNVFFSSNRKGGEGSFDIYTAKIIDNNTFSRPKNIGRPISTEKYEFDPYISPDERFIIFSINENGNSSLYYSYRDKNKNWTTPQNLGNKINITNQDFAPSLSQDGKFIFFSNNGKLKWVNSGILNIPK